MIINCISKYLKSFLFVFIMFFSIFMVFGYSMYEQSIIDSSTFNKPSTWLVIPQDDFSNWYYLEDWEIEMCLKPSESSFSEYYQNDYSINTNYYANAYDLTISLSAQENILTNYVIDNKYRYEYSYYIEPLGKTLEYSLTFIGENNNNSVEKKIEFFDGEYSIEIENAVSNFEILYSDYEFDKIILDYKYDGNEYSMSFDIV